MLKLAVRLAALASVELIRTGTYAELAQALESPACAAIPGADRIAVTTVGHGPDVILIPGLASSAHVWDATVAHLAPHFRVHVVQVAGFAGMAAGANATGPVFDPTVEAIHAYIFANKLSGASVIGHSLGGTMAMKLALAHPGDAGRLLIVDALPFYGVIVQGPQATVASVQPFAAAMRDRIANGTQEAYAAVEPRVMAKLIKSHTPEADAAVAAAAASDHAVVAQAMYEDFATDLRPEIAKIAVPVTMLYPYDAATGASQAIFDGLYTRAYAPMRQAKVKRIDGSFHFIMIDQPQVFLSEVDQFLKD